MGQDKVSVLYIDDMEDITYYSAKMLEAKGYAVYQALDKNTAIEIFKKEQPDIVVLEAYLDYSLEDGLELLDMITKAEKKVEVIIISAINKPEDRARVEEYEIACYFRKAVGYEEWMPKIHEAAERIRKRNS